RLLGPRIVAAVNACRGYLTEMLENGIIEAESDANRKWETTMMEAIGEDGYKSVAEAIAMLKEQYRLADQFAMSALRERDEARAMVKELAALLEGVAMVVKMTAKGLPPADLPEMYEVVASMVAKAKALS